MQTEYDPKTCITAGELRLAGAEGIGPDIPDCAWVPRGAVDYQVGKLNIKDGAVFTSVAVTFREPLRWIQIDIPPQTRILEDERDD